MITNTRTHKKLAEDETVCSSVWSKGIGLMFSPPRNLVFVFNRESIQPLHMLFVFFPIDVIFLNKKKQVVDIKEHFLPFMLYTPKKPAKYVVELRDGKVAKSKTRINDFLDISSL